MGTFPVGQALLPLDEQQALAGLPPPRSMSGRVLLNSVLSAVCKRAPMSQALLTSAARRQLLGSATPRRLATGSQLGSALCGRPAGLPALQRQQQQRRLAAAAAASAAAAEATAAAASTSAQRKELPKNFDPAASEEALYQW